ncbi:hypothetical protein PVK06_047415 [Gossypium arboreum]|uniref:Uncharacterized protein n=1 Tax=Gossypium arboreum TaxID=29729 RepID=A0ABR0MF51_GOSAR|nr:hypothetical protein PVK06_047415 [Gossypium arboreum]
MQQISIPYSPSNLQSSCDLFTTIWKVWVPPKVHITVWRFLCNYVPTFHNLYSRYISTTHFYPRCLNIPETPTHVLRTALLPFRFGIGFLYPGLVSSAFVAEALALLSALEFARDLGLSRVMFEEDSLHVIRKLNSTQADWSDIWALVTEGRLRLITFLQQLQSAIASKSRIGLLTYSRHWNFAGHRTFFG